MRVPTLVRASLLISIAALLALGMPAAAQAGFGIKSLSAENLEEGGAVDLRAGSHPFEFKLDLQLNLDPEEKPEGTLSQVVVDLPAGMVGNPQAVPRCPAADFEGQQALCPGNSQIGVADIHVVGVEEPVHPPIYNLEPPLGVAASIGFSVAGENSFQEALLRTGSDYGVRVSDITVPTGVEVQSLTERIWGVPAAPSHDSERRCKAQEEGHFVLGCANEQSPAPFLTLPTSCTGPLTTTITVSSVQEPGASQVESVQSLGEDGLPQGLHGCDRPAFKPTIQVRPETAVADSPTGLHVGLRLPQGQDPGGIATANLRDTVLTLPRGMAVNPSAASGLGACSPAEIDLDGLAPANCPADSKLGTVSIATPLLDHRLPGAIYLATQGDNPFGSLLALYVTVDDPISGVVVKLAGKVEPDPVTGQLRASFRDNPQLPFEDLSVDFSGGPRASLTTPLACGTYTTSSDLTPWTAPEGSDAFPSDSFQIDSGPSGSCVSGEAQAPYDPSFEAGTAVPIAGGYSPFVFKLTRENGSQRIGSIEATLPEGLVGKLAGIPYCSDAQITAAQARVGLGQGALEQASPSCPLASEVGTVTVGAGSGTPFYVQGHAYLAGPYKGAPLSLEIITPAVAGPFDLGVVAVRTALNVDEHSAQIHAVSDPIPSILQGIPLDVRSIALNMNRPQFTLNPTSCDAMAVLGGTTSTLGRSTSLRSRFQVGGCKGLAFKPALKLSFTGQTKRTGYPAVKAVLTQPAGENANVASTTVILPKGMLIANAHINNPCTRVQFNSTPVAGEGCPVKSVLGTAKVWSPLLENPEAGKVYFRSNGGERQLPDLVVALRGQIPLQLVGFIDSVGKKGAEVRRVRSRFMNVPDAPVSRFELKLSGGKKGLLENSKSLCRSQNKATFKLTGQNGKSHDTEPDIQVSCGKGSGKKKKS
jgi:hypothetical protein